MCALVLLGRLGDKSRRGIDALRVPPPTELPPGALAEPADAGSQEATTSPAPVSATAPTEAVEQGGAGAAAGSLPNLGVTDVPAFNDAAAGRLRFSFADPAAASPESGVAGQGNRLALVSPGAPDGAGPSDANAVVDASASAERAPEPRRDEAVREAAPPQSQALCGRTVCPPGQVCCNSSCGLCTAPGGTCSQQMCGVETMPISAPCGPNTCNVGQVCCNASCGICTSPGGTCDQHPCESAKVPFSVSCGLNTCNVGQVCCNPSCGICALPGEACSTEPCP